jgi:hypothetical protein
VWSLNGSESVHDFYNFILTVLPLEIQLLKLALYSNSPTLTSSRLIFIMGIKTSPWFSFH